MEIVSVFFSQKQLHLLIVCTFSGISDLGFDEMEGNPLWHE